VQVVMLQIVMDATSRVACRCDKSLVQVVYKLYKGNKSSSILQGHRCYKSSSSKRSCLMARHVCNLIAYMPRVSLHTCLVSHIHASCLTYMPQVCHTCLVKSAIHASSSLPYMPQVCHTCLVPTFRVRACVLAACVNTTQKLRARTRQVQKVRVGGMS